LNLTSVATAQCLRLEQLGQEKFNPSLNEVRLLATIQPDIDNHDFTYVRLLSLEDRGFLDLPRKQ